MKLTEAPQFLHNARNVHFVLDLLVGKVAHPLDVFVHLDVEAVFKVLGERPVLRVVAFAPADFLNSRVEVIFNNGPTVANLCGIGNTVKGVVQFTDQVLLLFQIKLLLIAFLQ